VKNMNSFCFVFVTKGYVTRNFKLEMMVQCFRAKMVLPLFYLQFY
jgi:hypothetical protein